MGFKAGDVLRNKTAIIIGLPEGDKTAYYDLDKRIVMAHWDVPVQKTREKRKGTKRDKDFVREYKPIVPLYIPFHLPNLGLPTYPGYIHPRNTIGDVYVDDPTSGRPSFVEVPEDFISHGIYFLIDVGTNQRRQVQAQIYRRKQMESILQDKLPGKIIAPGEIEGTAISFLTNRKKDPKKIVRHSRQVGGRSDWLTIIVQLQLANGLSLYIPVEHLENAYNSRKEDN